MNKIHTIALLIIIISIALLLRVTNLSSNPPGLFADEASIGYNAYTLVNLGTDEFGEKLPLFFRSFGDYKPGLPIYSTVPFVYLFGLSEFSVRLPFAIYGTLLIALIYLLGKELYSVKFGIVSSIIASVSPWLLHYSRIAFELITFPTFIVASLLFLLKSRQKSFFIIIFFVILGLTFYTYRSSFLITPLFLISLLAIYKKLFLKNVQHTIIGFSLFLIIATPLIASFLDGTGLQRFQQVSILSQPLPFSERLISIADNYFYQLTPNLLFIKGEPTPISRHFTDGLTPLLPITFPFLILGTIYIIKNIKKTSSKLFIVWILIYPISGALAGPPFTSRSIVGAPVFIFLIALGIIYSKDIIPKKIWKQAYVLFFTLFAINLAIFIPFYYKSYPNYSAGYWGWQSGPKEIVSYFSLHEIMYDQLYMQGEFNAPEIFFKFYAPNECRKCLIGDPAHYYNSNLKQVFAVTPEYIKNNPQFKYKYQYSVFYPNGGVAFELVEIVE